MDAAIVAHIAHVLCVVLWIGGVWFVTTVIIPDVIENDCSKDSLSLFERLESRFAWQARIVVSLTGLSGFYMLYAADSWHLFLNAGYWWFYAMVFIWLAFTLLLFVFEPLFLHQWFVNAVKQSPRETFRYILRLHRVMLVLSLITITGAVAGSHGWLLFRP